MPNSRLDIKWDDDARRGKNNHQVSGRANLRPLYIRSVVNSLGLGMVNPFIAVYTVESGASSSEMGWFQSVTSLSNNAMQVFWGKLSDRIGRRIPFIVLGGLIVAALWVPMMFVTTASQLIILIAIRALLGSMAPPAWTALIGDFVPSLELGRVSAAVNLWASVGCLIATLISGIIMVNMDVTPQEMLFVPFLTAIALGQASMTAYLLDIAPEEHRGSFTVFYSLPVGVTSFFGSLFGRIPV